MKPILLIIYSFLLCISLQAQVQKTLVKSIATSSTTASTQQAFFKLPGKAVVSRWDENFIRVTTHLKVENMNESIVKQLLMVGRYTISSQINEENQTLLVYMPKIANKITVKGTQLSELFEFEISVPKGYSIQINHEADDLLGQSL